MSFDLAIIGGGPGGYVAAQRAGAAGLKTVLFEAGDLGGVCLNEGCIPTKTLLYSAKLLDYARHSDKYGINVESAGFDFIKMMKRKEKVRRKLVGGIKLSMKSNGVEVINGFAQIKGKGEGGVIIQSGDLEYRADKLLICAGASALVPPIPGLKEAGDYVVTNREILSLDAPPQNLVIIGGGVIGMEFASLFNSLGSSVTVIEMLPKILGNLDTEISTILQGIYSKKGVSFNLGCKVIAIEGSTVVFLDAEGQERRVSGDRILLSVGRRANLKGYGLETLGVECDRGIKVDSRMRTNVPGVYAAGDVTGFSQLAHTASREGEVAVNDILGRPDEMSYDLIPGVVYTNPEVAGVGLTEDQAISIGVDYKVVRLPMAFSGRFVAENDGGEGICKVLVDKAGEKVLGVHMLGNPCSEIIHSVCIPGVSLDMLKKTVFPHPSVSEIIKESLFALGD